MSPTDWSTFFSQRTFSLAAVAAPLVISCSSSVWMKAGERDAQASWLLQRRLLGGCQKTSACHCLAPAATVHLLCVPHLFLLPTFQFLLLLLVWTSRHNWGGARVWGAEELRTRVQMRSLFTLSLFLKQNMIGPKHPSLRNTWTDLRNTSAICVNMVPASYRQVLCLDCRLTLLSVTRCLGFITSCDTTQSVMGCLVSCSTT